MFLSCFLFFFFIHSLLFYFSVKVGDFQDWKEIVQIMKKNEKMRIIPKRPEIPYSALSSKTVFGENSLIEVIDTKTYYLSEIKNSFDLPKIKKFLLEKEIFLTIDCLNSPISTFLLPILTEIGLDESNLLNSELLPDFAGKIPTPNEGKQGIKYN